MGAWIPVSPRLRVIVCLRGVVARELTDKFAERPDNDREEDTDNQSGDSREECGAPGCRLSRMPFLAHIFPHCCTICMRKRPAFRPEHLQCCVPAARSWAGCAGSRPIPADVIS